MRDTFRQSMAWLHTWVGLACGGLLGAIFLTGTLSVFREPITHWMEARPVLQAAPTPGGASAAAPAWLLARAVAHLQDVAPAARWWRIDLPRHAGEAWQLSWRPGSARAGEQQAALHPASGEVLPLPWGRKTEGGRHFMQFHYMLHAGQTGFWVVGAVAMFALVALVSGVVVHRRIFADFFTFRPGKGQRSWLDAHNASAVLTLPFLFMIVYTGLAFFYTSYMPWPLQAVYGNDQAHARYEAELAPGPPPLNRPRANIPAPLTELWALLQQARDLSGRPARTVLIEHPGDRQAVVRVLPSPAQTQAADHGPPGILEASRRLSFDGASGALLQAPPPLDTSSSGLHQAHRVIEALHTVSFGDWGMKWLYFLSGLLGSGMIAMGNQLFVLKRRRQSGAEFGPATAGVYRLAEAVNVASLAGVCLASAGYLYANRLIPASWPGRELLEIRAFLLLLAISLLHALWLAPRRAWVQQLSAAGGLCVALPLLNGLSTGEHLLSYAARGDGQALGVEATALALGCLLLCMAWRLRRPGPGGRRP